MTVWLISTFFYFLYSWSGHVTKRSDHKESSQSDMWNFWVASLKSIALHFVSHFSTPEGQDRKASWPIGQLQPCRQHQNSVSCFLVVTVHWNHLEKLCDQGAGFTLSTLWFHLSLAASRVVEWGNQDFWVAWCSRASYAPGPLLGNSVKILTRPKGGCREGDGDYTWLAHSQTPWTV